MVFEYQVVAGDRRSVAPDPPAGNSGVEKVGNFVVNDAVVESVHDYNAAAGHMDASAVLYYAVGNGVVVSEVSFIPIRSSAVDTNASGSAVEEIAPGNADFRAAFSDKYAVKTVVNNAAFSYRAILSVFKLNRSRTVGGCLRIRREAIAFIAVNAGGIVVGCSVGKFQAAETDVSDMIVGTSL